MSRPPSAAERRRVGYITFRNRVRSRGLGRATRFLPFPLQMLLFTAGVLAFTVAITLGVMRIFQSDHYYRERVAAVEKAITDDNPNRGSRYCRSVYADSPLYADCQAGEQAAWSQFAAAWPRARQLSTLRDLMIRCYQEGQETSGRSWQSASRCAELDQPVPGAR